MRLSNLDTNVDKNSEIELQARIADMHFDAAATIVPVQPGTIVAYIGNTAPDGWLLCDGSEIDSQYNVLISLIGTHTPDMRGKMAYCVSDTSKINETGGTFNHTHTIPSHSHTCESHTHTIIGHVHHTLPHSSHSVTHYHYGGSHKHRIVHYHAIPGHAHSDNTITFSADSSHYHTVPYYGGYTSPNYVGPPFYGWATGTYTTSGGNCYGSKSSKTTVYTKAISHKGVTGNTFTKVGTDTTDGAGNTTSSDALTSSSTTSTATETLYSSNTQITEDASSIGIVYTSTSNSVTVNNNISSISDSSNAAAYIINFIIKY